MGIVASAIRGTPFSTIRPESRTLHGLASRIIQPRVPAGTLDINAGDATDLIDQHAQHDQPFFARAARLRRVLGLRRLDVRHIRDDARRGGCVGVGAGGCSATATVMAFGDGSSLIVTSGCSTTGSTGCSSCGRGGGGASEGGVGASRMLASMGVAVERGANRRPARHDVDQGDVHGADDEPRARAGRNA